MSDTVARLRAIAQAATEGPWEREPHHDFPEDWLIPTVAMIQDEREGCRMTTEETVRMSDEVWNCGRCLLDKRECSCGWPFSYRAHRVKARHHDCGNGLCEQYGVLCDGCAEADSEVRA